MIDTMVLLPLLRFLIGWAGGVDVHGDRDDLVLRRGHRGGIAVSHGLALSGSTLYSRRAKCELKFPSLGSESGNWLAEIIESVPNHYCVGFFAYFRWNFGPLSRTGLLRFYYILVFSLVG
jgi:hypothetical protein